MLSDLKRYEEYNIVKVSDIPKPAKYSHKVPWKTGNSEYNRCFANTRGQNK
jgi:hypothetical protein